MTTLQWIVIFLVFAGSGVARAWFAHELHRLWSIRPLKRELFDKIELVAYAFSYALMSIIVLVSGAAIVVNLFDEFMVMGG